MALRGKQYFKKGPVTKRRYNTRKKMVLNQRTGGFRGMEKKFLDRAINEVPTLLDSWQMMDPIEDCLNSLDVGTGESQRIGRNISILGFKLRYFFERLPTTDSGSVVADTKLRIICFIDKQTNGASPTVEQVLDLQTPSPVIVAPDISFLNLQFRSRFQILYDKQHILKPQGNQQKADVFASGLAFSHTFEYNKYWKNGLKITYDGVGDTVASITDKSIHVMCFSTNPLINLSYGTRIRYVG